MDDPKTSAWDLPVKRSELRELVRAILDELRQVELPEVLDTVQAARYARRSVPTVRAWIEGGDLPATKRGRRWAVRRADLDRFLAGLGKEKGRPMDDILAAIRRPR